MADRRILVRLFPAVLVALSAITASGQSMMDREGPPPRAHPAAAPNPAEALRASACAIAARPSIGTSILASPPQSPEERRAAVALVRDGERCLHLARPLVASVAIVRGAAAESLYEAQFAAPIAARTPAVAVAPMPRPPEAAAGGYVYVLAECVGAARQDLVRALLASDPATRAEEAAFQAFNPIFESCTPPGIRMEVGTRELRSLLAEALYRWSVVQRDGPTSPWAAGAAAMAPAH